MDRRGSKDDVEAERRSADQDHPQLRPALVDRFCNGPTGLRRNRDGSRDRAVNGGLGDRVALPFPKEGGDGDHDDGARNGRGEERDQGAGQTA